MIRVLDPTVGLKSIDDLGLVGKTADITKEAIQEPFGMVLITGPTGSGKTTTLYSILSILNTIEVKICTIEDPIEYAIGRVTQIQVNTKTGVEFSTNGLRALMRHDPDIIMVGEIRDKETAEISIHSALTEAFGAINFAYEYRSRRNSTFFRYGCGRFFACIRTGRTRGG